MPQYDIHRRLTFRAGVRWQAGVHLVVDLQADAIKDALDLLLLGI